MFEDLILALKYDKMGIIHIVTRKNRHRKGDIHGKIFY